MNRRVFDLVLAIDRRTAELHAAGQGTPGLGEKKRRVLRGLRFLREQVLLRAATLHPDRLYAPGRPAFALERPDGAGPGSLPLDRQPRALRPPVPGRPPAADVLHHQRGRPDAERGHCPASEDNMFSHYSVGYVTDREHTIRGKTYAKGTLLTIESLIERGVVIEPFPTTSRRPSASGARARRCSSSATPSASRRWTARPTSSSPGPRPR